MNIFTTEARHWYEVPERGTDCWHWLPFLTEEELGWPIGSKLTIDHRTGELLVTSTSAKKAA